MQPEQDPTETDTPETLRRRQFIEFLQQQQLLIQQRQQQSSNLLPLLSDANLTENTNPNWNTANISSNVAAPTFDPPSTTLTSIVEGGSFSDVWSNPQQDQYDQEYLQFEEEEDDLFDNKDEEKDAGASTEPSKIYIYDNPATSDFVKKLYRMLEEPRFQPVVCWGPLGDRFIVKDMQECTKSVLPRLFKHSNFSSFVRQLNKYGFHKVKYTGDNQYGEHSWVFRHPDFRAGQPEALEKIKRKPSPQRKTAQESQSGAPAAGPSGSSSLSASMGTRPTFHRGLSFPQGRFAPTARPLVGITQDLNERLATLERNQEGLLGEISHFQQGLAERNELLQNLIARSSQIPNKKNLTYLLTKAADGAEASLEAFISNPVSSMGLQGYPGPSPLQPLDLGLDPQQLPLADMLQQPGSASSSTYRLIQPSFDPGDLLSFPGFQSQPRSSRSRTHRCYSANDAQASGYSSILGQYDFDDDAEGDDDPST